MFVIVVYDIFDDRRRARLFKALKNFGTAIQFSAFECILNKKNFVEMQGIISRITRRDEDKVRIYTLCHNCQTSIMNMGRGEIVQKRDVIVV